MLLVGIPDVEEEYRRTALGAGSLSKRSPQRKAGVLQADADRRSTFSRPVAKWDWPSARVRPRRTRAHRPTAGILGRPRPTSDTTLKRPQLHNSTRPPGTSHPPLQSSVSAR
eukprot:scaffold14295_cov116-Isochrysis_galbana.AAC.4